MIEFIQDEMHLSVCKQRKSVSKSRMEGERKKTVREDRNAHGYAVVKKIVMKYMLAREHNDSTPCLTHCLLGER